MSTICKKMPIFCQRGTKYSSNSLHILIFANAVPENTLNPGEEIPLFQSGELKLICMTYKGKFFAAVALRVIF